MNSTLITITAGLAFGAAVGSLFGLAIVGAGVGIAVGTLADEDYTIAEPR